jgi:hypothetical protein
VASAWRHSMVTAVQSTRWSSCMIRPSLRQRLGTAQSRLGTREVASVCRRSRAIAMWSGRRYFQTTEPGPPRHLGTAKSRPEAPAVIFACQCSRTTASKICCRPSRMTLSRVMPSRMIITIGLRQKTRNSRKCLIIQGSASVQIDLW